MRSGEGWARRGRSRRPRRVRSYSRNNLKNDYYYYSPVMPPVGGPQPLRVARRWSVPRPRCGRRTPRVVVLSLACRPRQRCAHAIWVQSRAIPLYTSITALALAIGAYAIHLRRSTVEYWTPEPPRVTRMCCNKERPGSPHTPFRCIFCARCCLQLDGSNVKSEDRSIGLREAAGRAPPAAPRASVPDAQLAHSTRNRKHVKRKFQLDPQTLNDV